MATLIPTDRPSFEALYVSTLKRFLTYAPTTIGSHELASRLADLAKARPTWVDEIEADLERRGA